MSPASVATDGSGFGPQSRSQARGVHRAGHRAGRHVDPSLARGKELLEIDVR